MGKIHDVAREIAQNYLESGNLRYLLEKVSSRSVWFGRFGSANRKAFLDSLFTELGLQNKEGGK